MTHKERARSSLASMPQEKFRRKLLRTIVGLLIVLTGVGAKTVWPDLPDLVAFGTFGLGLLMVSGELMVQPLKLFTASLRDIFDAIFGRNGHRRSREFRRHDTADYTRENGIRPTFDTDDETGDDTPRRDYAP